MTEETNTQTQLTYKKALNLLKAFTIIGSSITGSAIWMFLALYASSLGLLFSIVTVLCTSFILIMPGIIASCNINKYPVGATIAAYIHFILLTLTSLGALIFISYFASGYRPMAYIVIFIIPYFIFAVAGVWITRRFQVAVNEMKKAGGASSQITKDAADASVTATDAAVVAEKAVVVDEEIVSNSV